MWQGRYGDDAGKAAGIHYLQTLARKQEAAGASYLDINLDEFSTDIDERVRMMSWTVDIVQQAVGIPVSVDSSNTAILRAGLQAADTSRQRPMVNSVSLERTDAIATAAEHNAVVVASAAGEKDLPDSVGGRLANLAALMPFLRDAGLRDPDIHIDPLVFPISTDSRNGRQFLDATARVRKVYGPGIHVVAGLSNISFGMPCRKLINQVFTCLALEAGADGGIVDPLQINPAILGSLDRDAEPYRLAKALLLGEDDFGMNFITASRDGRLG
jgi:5-methyltetrahydrofolate--homocysteine methyltransferase